MIFFFWSDRVNIWWQDLCKRPSAAVKVVVRDFYTNLSEQEDKKVSEFHLIESVSMPSITSPL